MNDDLQRANRALLTALIVAMQGEFDHMEDVVKSKVGEVPAWVEDAHDKLLKFYSALLD
jgi:tellurite resistance protein